MTAEILDEILDVPLRIFGHAFRCSAFDVREAGQRRAVLCLHLGNLHGSAAHPVLVRIHSGCALGEVFESGRCDCGWQLRDAVNRVAGSERGVVVYLPGDDGRGNGLVALVRSIPLIDSGASPGAAYHQLGLSPDTRTYAAAVAVLKRLQVEHAVVVTNNPQKVSALTGADIDVRAQVPSEMVTSDDRLRRFLKAKRAERADDDEFR